MGGDTGSGPNPQAGIMAALGDCSTLNGSTSIELNEVTTVGSVFALAPFMSSYSALGTSSTNTAGMVRAFASVNKLVNVKTGGSPGPALPAGATAPNAEVNSLANVLAACVNSGGGTTAGTPCGNLFKLATPSGGTSPTDTIGLALAIAKNPALNVSAIFKSATPDTLFTPILNSAPNDWTMSIDYTGFSAPKSATVDANGNIWVANASNNSVTVLAQTGTPVATLSGNGLSSPGAIAIDATGNGWVANTGASTVSVFTAGGGVYGASPFTVGKGPSAIAMDAPGDIWVTGSGDSSVTELNSNGGLLQQVTTGISSPVAIAVDPD